MPQEEQEEMLLASPEGQSFELRILGYQYPQEATVEYDSNWLQVQGNVAHPRGNWTFRDPCLLTYEAARLATWLESVAHGCSADSELSFREPNIWFEQLPNPAGSRLRIYFELESRPSWAPSKTVDEADCFVDVPTVALDLQRAASSLREQLSRYPQRTRL